VILYEPGQITARDWLGVFGAMVKVRLFWAPLERHSSQQLQSPGPPGGTLYFVGFPSAFRISRAVPMSHPFPQEMRMKVVVYGKDGCVLCEAAKDKLNRMGVPFTFDCLQKYTEYHDGWRVDGSVDLLAFHTLVDTLPIIQIDGELFTYPQAMKKLRDVKPATVPKPVPADLACAV
jgi:glutaredoxin